MFNLSERYALQVGSHLSTLSFIFAALPGCGVGRLLASQAEAWTHTNPNSWESAFYRALAADSWYVNGGWRQAVGPHPLAVAPAELQRDLSTARPNSWDSTGRTGRTRLCAFPPAPKPITCKPLARR
ncbi:hypothetical protein AB0A81_28230 [Streptomyces flaveolus]|uniref:Uncharacterized protein n=1 Tax=Streptomyces flaveolus TaxID=67297 RepID=A0ABV1VBG5_9ACTN